VAVQQHVLEHAAPLVHLAAVMRELCSLHA
jgi:hypothetical protein